MPLTSSLSRLCEGPLATLLQLLGDFGDRPGFFGGDQADFGGHSAPSPRCCERTLGAGPRRAMGRYAHVLARVDLDEARHRPALGVERRLVRTAEVAASVLPERLAHQCELDDARGRLSGGVRSSRGPGRNRRCGRHGLRWSGHGGPPHRDGRARLRARRLPRSVWSTGSPPTSVARKARSPRSAVSANTGGRERVRCCTGSMPQLAIRSSTQRCIAANGAAMLPVSSCTGLRSLNPSGDVGDAALERAAELVDLLQGVWAGRKPGAHRISSNFTSIGSARSPSLGVRPTRSVAWPVRGR